MKEELVAGLENPAALEELYRSDKAAFKQEFNRSYPEIKQHVLAGFWNERLNYKTDEPVKSNNRDLIFVITACLLAGFLAKLPAIFHIDDEFFYTRNIGFVALPLLTAYFAWKNKLTTGKMLIAGGFILAGVIFINLLPNNPKSDTLTLSCIHLVLFLWSILGFAFAGKNDRLNRLNFLKYIGDLAVMAALIVIACGITTAITVGLFSLIGIDIREFYFQNIGIVGAASVPIVATYLTQTNPQLVGRISPVIARIFSPLVLVMLVIYLTAILYSGKDPYNDREFLLIFNVLLIGVMALIFFSVADSSTTIRSNAEIWILFLLSAVTIIVNGIALSAILFRIAEMGITPNRVAVLGANLLILGNLIIVTAKLFTVASRKNNLSIVGRVMAAYLPVYMIWATVITFLFPFLFGFK